MNLPETNGLTICDQVRSQSDVPIIFVTSNNTSMDELNCIMRGAFLIGCVAGFFLEQGRRETDSIILDYPYLYFLEFICCTLLRRMWDL